MEATSFYVTDFRSQELERFPRLHAQLIECVSELLRERLGPTSQYAQSLIEIQAAYINTNHPAFISGSAVAAQMATSQAQKQPSPPRVSSNHILSNLCLPTYDRCDSYDLFSKPGTGLR